jgi:hypothetical protein
VSSARAVAAPSAIATITISAVGRARQRLRETGCISHYQRARADKVAL